MATGNAVSGTVPPPGTERPRRYRPKLRYELIGCGLHGHELLGTDAAALRPQDDLFAREGGGLRWYRCLRCDSWVALSPPDQPTQKYPPERRSVSLPLRGRPLRDRYVLRVIAVERVIHFLVLSALAAATFLFADNKATLSSDFMQILKDLQGGLGGPVNNTNHGLLHDLQRLFAVSTTNLYLLGTGIAVYALLEGVESVGLWAGKRWAEYLTFIATVIFVPYEVYELTKSITALKVITLIINLVIVIYLVVAKRLFGLRGGGKAERAEHEQDTGWEAIERATPRPGRTPSAVSPLASVSREASASPDASASPKASVPPDASTSPEASIPPEASASPDASASREVPVPPEVPVSPERPATGPAGR